MILLTIFVVALFWLIPNPSSACICHHTRHATVPQFATEVRTDPQPVGESQTAVTGVNTAGTVRVNNLANLEAVLDIGADFGETTGILLAIRFLLRAARKFRAPSNSGRSGWQQLGMAAVIFILALSLPGAVNWLIDAARDPNCFE